MAQYPSGYDRVDDEFYAEPPECTASLIDAFAWLREGFHDPFCGTGTTIDTAAGHGISATGADMFDRCNGRFPIREFFTDAAIYRNIVGNPPYKQAAEVIEHGLRRLYEGGRIAILANVNFLSAQRRYHLHTRPEFEGVLVLMKRPSCPPGEMFHAGKIKRKGGKANYGWFVYQRGRTGGGASLYFAKP